MAVDPYADLPAASDPYASLPSSKPTTDEYASVPTKPSFLDKVKRGAERFVERNPIGEAITGGLTRVSAALGSEQSQKQLAAEEAKAVGFQDLYKNPDNFKKIYDYAKARFGKSGEPEPGESQEDYVKRWASHMRMVTTGNLISGTEELQYLNSAKREDLLKAKEAYDLFDNTASYFSSKGQGGFKPVLDVLGSMVTDPTTAISLGAGRLASSALIKQAAEQGLQKTIAQRLSSGAAKAAVPFVEGAGAAASNVTEQKRTLTVEKAQLDQMKELLPQLSAEDQAKFKPDVDALEAKVNEGISGTEALIAGAVGAGLGTLETKSMLKAADKLKGKPTELSDILTQRKANMPATPKVEVKAVSASEKALEDQYDIFEGRKLLDKEGDPTSVAEMQIKNDVNKKATELASEIWNRVPDLAPKEGQKVSEAVKNVFMNIENIDNVVLEDALSKAGLTAEEFARMNRTTVGDAGRTLQAYSVLARIQNKLKSIDPAAAKEVDLMYGNRNALTSAFTGLRDFGMRLDRELKALMVSQLATTIRNGFSGLSVVTFGTASDAIESALYRMGKTASELASGKPVTGTFTGGLKGVYDDAVRTVFYLGQKDLSSDVADALLAQSPTLQSRIIKTAGEAGDKNLSKAAQLANTFNVAQDAFFRKAIFTSSVEKQLSRVGINMYDILAQGKQIPFDVLRNATDEALTATFSKMPTKGPMFHAVKFIEELGPVGSTVIPFPRFMANAMSWTYKHSPMGVFSGAADIAKGSVLLKGGNEEGQRYLAQGLENVSKGAVGTAAIYAAYKYRQENQDTNWYDVKDPDGSLVDARAFFPVAPYLALGDYLVKFQKGRTDEFKAKELIEAVTGFKAPAGTYSWLGDKFSEAASNMQTGEGSADTKVSQFFGEWAGEYLGRAFVPFAQLSDIIGAIDRDETLPRDAYQIPAGEEGFTSSAKNQLMKRIPVVKQELPVYQPATREEAAFNDAGPLKMLSGVTIKQSPTAIEQEITRLHIDANKIFTSTGDKIVDARAREVMGPLLVQVYDPVVNTDFYKSASPDQQKIVLQNLLGFVQRNSKEIATKESEAEAFNRGEQARIFAVKYSALPAEVKRATAEMYKQNTGSNLEDTKDYAAALAYAAAIRNTPKFSGGGLLAKELLGDVAGSAVKAATKSSSTILKEMQQAAATAGAKAIEPAIEQTKKIIKPKAAASSPTPSIASELSPVAKEPTALNMTTKAEDDAFMANSLFSDVDQKPKLSYDELPHEDKIKKVNVDGEEKLVYRDPDDMKWYDEEGNNVDLAKGKTIKDPYTADLQKPKLSYDELPYEDKVKTVNVDGGEKTVYRDPDDMKWYDEDGNSVDLAKGKTNKDPYLDTPPVQATKKEVNSSEGLVGDLNLIGSYLEDNAVEKRKQLIQNIKDERTFSHGMLMNEPALSKLKDADLVIGITQGEFRSKYYREVDPFTEKSVEKFTELAQQQQKRLDILRLKYRNVPDVSLYHGTTSGDIGAIKKGGFTNPQQYHRWHSELEIGGTSFTRDMSLGVREPSFGGKSEKNYVSTSMPYAEYEFARINMHHDAYDNKDLNTIAKTITGSPNVVRPLSLPRAGFSETEDVIVESEKLIPKQKLKSDTKDIAVKVKKATSIFDNISDLRLKFRGEVKNALSEQITDEYGNLITRPRDVDKITDEYGDLVTKSRAVPAKKQAYAAYDTLRQIMKEHLDLASVATTKKGIGHNYSFLLRRLQESKPDIDILATVLEEQGATQKANNLRELSSNLGRVTNEGKSRGTDAIRKLTPKLAKGGLVKRRG